MIEPATLVDTEDDVQSRISRYWSRHAESYDAYQRSQLAQQSVRAAWSGIWSRALPTPPADVLDVGTGTGHVALLLAEVGHRVTGIDLAEGMLDRARAKAKDMPDPPTLQLGDAVAPDFPPGSFDVITSRYVLWTLREPVVALENWRSLLRPGGTLVAVDSTWFPDGIHGGTAAEPDGKQADFRALYNSRTVSALPLAESRTIDDTVAMVRAAGFTEVTVTPLEEILELDRAHGVAEGHQVQMQFLITGLAG